MSQAYIALGSNLEEPLQQLHSALRALNALPETALVKASSIYQSAAVGPGDQPDYLNAAVLLDTRLGPQPLLVALLAIEDEQGRQRTVRWGPRTLDLDLLLYDHVTMNTHCLTLPHPRLRERDFVLYPLHEISDTNQMLPGDAELDTLISRCQDNGLIKTEWQLGTG
ncbi:MAG: 2-amino-4-hydroxy-6-hydroxymethyldihydropteridine diphosphokinase [Bacteroidia bacterium]|jgi:2-amino-4-hydroxy-6-hydroxymethyldihydropteridine diphosphokinase